MSSLLKFLIYVLSNVVSARLDDDPEPEPVEDELEPSEEDEEDSEPSEEDSEPSEEDDAPAPKLSRSQQAIIKLRNDKREAEERYQKVREELEATRRQPVQQVNTEESVLRQQEDAILNNPDATDWQKYAVTSARNARQAEQSSKMALREARDINDKAEFASLASTQPKTYAAYKDKVEDTLKQMRAKGQDAPRKELFAYLVGQDMINGRLKTSTAKSSAAKTGGVNRGKTPGVRSDVSTRDSGKLTEAEKRAKRLENVRI